jgi:nucleoside-diphosphate-sugar epimerase
VVVTGAAGFIGRVVVRTLLDAGHRVIAIDRRPMPDHPGLTVLTADLLGDDELVVVALATADAVIHLAGRPGVRDDGPRVRLHRYRDNVAATAVVLEHVPLETPLVVASSSSVYGGTAPGRPRTETDRPRPRGEYADSKLFAERLCGLRLCAGGRTAIARPFTVAGEGQRPDMALARWIAAARAGRPLRLLGSPDRTRDITDVRHAARALVTLAERGACGPVNIGTGVGHRLGDMVATVAEVLDTEVITQVVPAHPDEVNDTLADTRLLRRLVGFVPETDLRAVVTRQAFAALAPQPEGVAPQHEAVTPQPEGVAPQHRHREGVV